MVGEAAAAIVERCFGRVVPMMQNESLSPSGGAVVSGEAARPWMAANPAVVPGAVRQVSLRLEVADPSQDGDLGGIALPAELQRAVPVRQLHFRAGRYCALRALQLLDPERPVGTLARSPSGAPLWPAGVSGSITHTDGFVSAAVAHTTTIRSVGIDSECIMSPEQARSVATVVSWPSELAYARDAGLDRFQALTLVFSAKEAIFKCLHPLVGRTFDYHDVRIVGVDAGTGTFRARVVQTLSREVPADSIVGGRFEVGERWIHTGVFVPAARAALTEAPDGSSGAARYPSVAVAAGLAFGKVP